MPVVIEAKKRESVGKKSTKKHRREGYIPGVYYFHGSEAVPLLFDSLKMTQFLRGHRGLLDLKIEGEKEPLKCFLKDYQRDPVTDDPIHIDFQGVKMGEKIILSVPLIVHGSPVGVKNGGVLEHITRELEVECLPKHLPENLEIDVSHLDIGDSIHVEELKFENIKILDDPETTVVLVEMPRIVIEEEPTEEEEMVEPELIGEEREGEEGEEEKEDKGEREAKPEKEEKE